MKISFSLKLKDLVLVVWAVVVIALLTLVFGSFAEAEPRAGTIFAVVAALFIVAAYPLWRWRNKA